MSSHTSPHQNSVIPDSRALEIENLVVDYGSERAVDHVSFSVRSGEVYGILGPSGAGKSSILGAITGVTQSEGTIRLGGAIISPDPPRKRRLGNVYQDFRLFDWMTVFDNAAFGCRAQPHLAKEAKTRVHAVLEQFGLSGLAHRHVSQLSGGERQRVALARAIAANPGALLLDEPFSDLDPPLRQRLRSDLLRWLSDNPIPAVLVTHDRDEALQLCDRIAFLSSGRIHQEDTPGQLLENPRTAEVAAFIGYDNCMTGIVLRRQGEFVVVRTGSTEILARSVTNALGPGDKVWLRCRPRSIRASDRALPEENQIPARVELVHRFDDQNLAILALPGDETLSAQFPDSVVLKVGESTTITISPQQLIAYACAEGSSKRKFD